MFLTDIWWSEAEFKIYALEFNVDLRLGREGKEEYKIHVMTKKIHKPESDTLYKTFDRNVDIKIQYLKHFSLVARKKSFREASRIANISQAGLSSSIKMLEKILGQDLFERNYKITLTSYGDACLPSINQFLETYENLSNFLKSSARGNYGNIRVGCSPSFVYTFLPKILQKFTDKYPKVKVSVFDNTSSAIYKKLLDNELDVALSTLFEGKPPYISFTPFSKDRLGVLCHRDHSLARHKSIELKDIINYSFIGNDISRTSSDELLNFIHKNCVHYMVNVVSVYSMLETNLGITILPEYSFPKEKKDTLVWIPIVPKIERQIGVMHSNTKSLSLQTRSFITLCEELFSVNGM